MNSFSWKACKALPQGRLAPPGSWHQQWSPGHGQQCKRWSGFCRQGEQSQIDPSHFPVKLKLRVPCLQHIARKGFTHIWVLAFSFLVVCLGVVIRNSILVGIGLGNLLYLLVGSLGEGGSHWGKGKTNCNLIEESFSVCVESFWSQLGKHSFVALPYTCLLWSLLVTDVNWLYSHYFIPFSRKQSAPEWVGASWCW